MSYRRRTPLATEDQRSLRTTDGGFTLIEVVVAATLLVIGVLATLALVDNGAKATTSSLSRDSANAIAKELTERASGLRYDALGNALTDVNTASSTPTPADRLRASMAPTSSKTTAPVIKGTTTPIVQAPSPWATTAEWTVTRGGQDFTITYKACTRSETVSNLYIAGPYDCDRAVVITDPPPPNPQPLVCGVKATVPAGGAVTPSRPSDIVANIQLLNLVGVGACVKGTLDILNVGSLVTPLCNALGDGTQPLNTVAGLLNSVLGPVASSVALSVCPSSTGAMPSPQFAGGIATSTEVAVTVSWLSPSEKRSTITQNAVYRRAG